jgi:metallophosphoesterase (TIGR00282 family)
MNLLFIGDIYASAGRGAVASHLPALVEDHQVDLVIANVENAAGGFGVTPLIAEELRSLGIDVMTSGNHIWDKREIYEYLDRQPLLLRPANYPEGLPGTGVAVVRARNGVQCAVVNLQGRAHMPATDCPFRKADDILNSLDAAVKVRFVDFHAELTSEKVAMGWHLDGRVTAVFGTHTHVQTADERILPKGTACLTDTGMTGPHDSIIGVTTEVALARFVTGMPAKFESATGPGRLNAVIVTADQATGRATAIERLNLSSADVDALAPQTAVGG